MPSDAALEKEATKRRDAKIDKMFEVPLISSICMLAMAHGSNEINVSAPLAAELFLMNSEDTKIGSQIIIAIVVGIISITIGALTLGVRYLSKFRLSFMKVSLTNGFIVNSVCSILLFGASAGGYTISCTYILVPSMLLLRKMDKQKHMDPIKSIRAVIFAVSVTLGSALITVIVSYCLLWLDYNGPFMDQPAVQYYNENPNYINPIN